MEYVFSRIKEEKRNQKTREKKMLARLARLIFAEIFFCNHRSVQHIRMSISCRFPNERMHACSRMSFAAFDDRGTLLKCIQVMGRIGRCWTRNLGSRSVIYRNYLGKRHVHVVLMLTLLRPTRTPHFPPVSQRNADGKFKRLFCMLGRAAYVCANSPFKVRKAL